MYAHYGLASWISDTFMQGVWKGKSLFDQPVLFSRYKPRTTQSVRRTNIGKKGRIFWAWRYVKVK